MKSSTDYRMTFVYEQENNRPEKGSLIDLAKKFQKQVQVMDTTQENEIKQTQPQLLQIKK